MKKYYIIVCIATMVVVGVFLIVHAQYDSIPTFELIKLFVDIVGTIFIGIMSIKVSITSNNLTKQQINNEALLNMPFFEFDTQVFTYTDTNDSELTTIHNTGGNLTDFKYKAYTFLTLKSKSKSQVYYISDFMDSSTINQPNKGLLVGIITRYSRSHFFKILIDGIDYKKSTGNYVLVDLEKFIVITYNDLKKEKHTETYKYKNLNWTLVNSIQYEHNKSDQYTIKYLSSKTIDDLLNRNVTNLKTH